MLKTHTTEIASTSERKKRYQSFRTRKWRSKCEYVNKEIYDSPINNYLSII